ncbi:MAG: NAD(P)-dependent oxidoreductase [Deltaproteobacteria bacterium]|nr:NAD(P)-dependent oxidoreductase [Deltaproteobacteria bacterium]
MRYRKLERAFQEEWKGFSTQEAVTEATRCIKCEDAPCSKGCPAEIECSKFIRQIASRNFRGAIRVIKEDNILAGICARICPQKNLCEKECSSAELADPIQIGRLQRFAADQEMNTGPKPLKSLPEKEIAMAVVGSGPAGLSAATYLKRLGYRVDLFEAESFPGGILMYGIPAYRLPKQVVKQEIDYIQSLGVQMFTDHPVRNPGALLKRYKAVFLGTGVSRPIRPNIPGEENDGVIQALDLLKDLNKALIEKRDFNIDLGDHAVVIGGGNAAIDAAVTAKKLGTSKVTVLYRRSEKEMPAWGEERAFARRQGVEIQILKSPVRFVAEGDRLTAVECIEMELGRKDESGRKRPLPVTGSEQLIPCDTAILAIGQEPELVFIGLIRSARGLIKVNPETLATSVTGIYAGGDLIRGGDMAVKAVRDGKRAAFAIDDWCRSSSVLEQ